MLRQADDLGTLRVAERIYVGNELSFRPQGAEVPLRVTLPRGGLRGAHHFRIAFEVSSVPLSDTIMPGLQRCSIKAVSSRAKRRPEIEVSGIAARHSLVPSSMTFSTRKRRPQADWS
jgi:hypothetical protein